MVERQGAVDPVGRLGLGRGREAAHVELGAGVGDARRLGHAGGARGVDVERRVLGGDAVARGLAGRAQRRDALQGAVEVAVAAHRLVRRRAAHDPLRHRAAAGRRAPPRRPAAVSVSTIRWAAPGDRQAVGQARPGQVVVDQGGGHADLGEAVPDRDVFDAVGHEQRHGVAALDAPPRGPVGEAVGHGVELGIGDGPALEDDGVALGELVDRLLEVVADELGDSGFTDFTRPSVRRTAPRKRASRFSLPQVPSFRARVAMPLALTHCAERGQGIALRVPRTAGAVARRTRRGAQSPSPSRQIGGCTLDPGPQRRRHTDRFSRRLLRSIRRIPSSPKPPKDNDFPRMSASSSERCSASAGRKREACRELG